MAKKTISNTFTVVTIEDAIDAKYISLKGACHAPEGSELANPNDCELSICNGKDTITYTQDDFAPSLVTNAKRGFVIVYINRQTLEIANTGTPYFFDTYQEATERDWLTTAIQAAPIDYFVCLISYDAVGFSPALENALKACGGTSLKNNTAVGRYPFAFIGYRGLQEGYAVQIEGELESLTTADAIVYVANGNMTVSKNGADGVSYFLSSPISSVAIGANEMTAPVAGTFRMYRKSGDESQVQFNAFFSSYIRKCSSYTLVRTMANGNYCSISETVTYGQDAFVLFAFSSAYSGSSPDTQNYLAKVEIPIIKNADLVQPNILKRTIFDYGLDAIKDAWNASATSGTSWQCISIPNNTPDAEVQGRKSVRINASLLTNPQQGDTVDFYQNVIGSLKPSTWYTLSFYSFATHPFNTFLYDGEGNQHYVIDASAGWWVDGVYASGTSAIQIDGNIEWPADWSGQRHTITFKTVSSFQGISYFNIIFRTRYITSEQDRAQTALCMPKLELGQIATEYVPDEKDQRGKIGRFFYYGGVFDNSNNTTQFVVNDAQTPYFEHLVSGQKRYHVFNPDESPASGQMTMAEMWATGSDWNEKHWEVMTNDFKYLITEAIFATFAKLGSWIFNGDFMLSQHGTDGTGNYQNFDPQNPTSWTPNTLFNAFDGSGWLAGRRIEWNANGDLQIAGLVRKNKTVITASNISQYMTIVDTIYDTTTGSEVDVYMLNLVKAGNWVELNGLNRIGIKLPSIKHDVNYASEDVKDEARSLLGSSVILNLVSSTNIFFARTNMRLYYETSNSQGRIYVDCDPETAALYYLGDNNIVYLDCIDGEYKNPSTGFYIEDIKWIAKEYDKTSLANT